MSEKIISLDIQWGSGDAIDLAVMLPLSEARPIRHRNTDETIDDMAKWRGDADIFEVPTIHLDRLHNIKTLDLASSSKFSSRAGSHKKRRNRHINLVKPLYVPYGALDVRLMRKIVNEKKYTDLFTRSLSRSLMMRRTVKRGKKFLKRNRRGIIGVAATLFILTVPVLWYVKFSLEDGYAKFMALSGVKSIPEAQALVSSARTSFERAHFLFIPFSWIPLGPMDLARRASEGGLDLARAADTVLSILPTETGSTTEKKSTNPADSLYRAAAEDIFPLEKLGIDTPTDWIRTHKDELSQVANQIQDAAVLYVGTDDGSDIADKMRRVGGGLSKASSYISWYFDHEDNILNMLGDANPERYVVFDQNRDEIRANGGFPGTIISFTLYKGNILDYRKDDVYYYDWNLYPYKEAPPSGLALMTDTYGLRDVNYYPDFHDTVEKANSFIERSGDSTITTGIAIHQGLIEDILKEVGPVTVSGVTIPFDSKNFSPLMSTLVEAQYGRDLHAKTVLFDFVPAFLKKISDTRKYDAVFNVLEKQWKDGEILIASRDSGVDAFLSPFRKQLPWESDTRNWAYPIFTSIGGNKSDRYVTRKYTATTKKLENCVYENTITLTNTHTFSSTDKQAIKSYIKEFKITDPIIQNKVDFVEGDSPNKAFVRVYVPIGSTLISPGGSIKTEMGDHAAAFSFTLETPVGGSASKTLHYTTEIPHCVDYTGSVNWYRQPGLREVEMK